LYRNNIDYNRAASSKNKMVAQKLQEFCKPDRKQKTFALKGVKTQRKTLANAFYL
jgi:hypothetical protein